MTKKEACKLADLMIREKKTYKEGHYHYGYIYLRYIENRQQFEKKHEDLSTNVQNPTYRYEYMAKEEFVVYLMKNYTFASVKAKLY